MHVAGHARGIANHANAAAARPAFDALVDWAAQDN